MNHEYVVFMWFLCGFEIIEDYFDFSSRTRSLIRCLYADFSIVQCHDLPDKAQTKTSTLLAGHGIRQTEKTIEIPCLLRNSECQVRSP